MNIDDIKRLRELAGKATQGPWESTHHAVVASGGGRVADVACTRGKYEREKENRDYIAAANPSTITALCDLAERALAHDAQPSETVDTPEFRNKMEFWAGQFHSVFKRVRQGSEAAYQFLIGDINAWQRSVTAKAVADALAKQAAQPVALDDERGAFEAWGENYFNYGFDAHTWNGAEYSHEETQMAWEGWQARTLLSASSAADHSQPTDIGKSLREAVGAVMMATERDKLLLTTADECDRFYGGMMNWKKNAQAKDKTIIELREQLASSVAGQVKLAHPWTPSDQQFKDWCERYSIPEHHGRDPFDDAASLYLTALTQPNAAHQDNGGGNG